MNRLHHYLAGVLALAFTSGLLVAQAPDRKDFTTDHRLPPQGSVKGVWVWQPVYIENTAEQDRMIAFFKKNGFNRILMQVPWEKGSMAAGQPKLILQSQLGRLLDVAAKNGMVVEALDGSSAMARKAHWPATDASVDAILAFNKTRPKNARFVGLHWDIEPYTLPNWKTDERPAIMLEYLQCLARTKQKLAAEAPDMLLSVDIPMWYDNATEEGNSCVLEFNGQTKNLQEHTQDICDYVGIMSYRRHAEGKNSILAMIDNELNYAEKIGKRICPAMETIQLKDTPQITFFGLPPQEFKDQKAQLEAALKDRPGYQGVLVHCYPTVRNLLEGTSTVP